MPKKNQNTLENLIRQNIHKTEQLNKKFDKLEKDFKRFEFMNFLRFILVAIPIILAILYLVPVFREFVEIYRPLLELINQFKPL